MKLALAPRTLRAAALAALATDAACAGPSSNTHNTELPPPTPTGVVESPRAFEQSPSERASNTPLEGRPSTSATGTESGDTIGADLPTVDPAQLHGAAVQDCARGECAIEPTALGPPLPAETATSDGATGAPPVVAWFQTIRAGATVRYPRRAGADLLGVVLAGHAALHLAESPHAAAQSAGPWTAFLLPEGGALVRAEGTEPATLVLAGAQDAHGAGPGRVITGRAANARARGGYVVHAMSELPDLGWARGAFHARIAFEAPASPRASLEVLIGAPRAGVAEHNHPASWEVLVPLSAAGRLRIPAQQAGGGAGDAGAAPVAPHDRAVAAGSVQYVPVGTRHEWVPDGTAPLIAVQLYGPPGPEQRFRALAAGGAAGDAGVASGAGAGDAGR